MKKIGFSITLVIFAMYIGCSGIRTVPILTAEDDSHSTGFRYYESSPYILVYSNGKSLKSDLIYLPDRTRKMSVELFDYLSTNTAKLTFSNGVLTSSETEGDSTIVPNSIIEAAKQVAIAAAQKAAAFSTIKGRRPTFAAPPPYLFKLVVDGEKTKLIGGSYATDNGMLEIQVNVPKGG
jgi:hypothetical protein